MSRVLQHVAEEELLHAHDTQEAARRRRAAVFYLDRGRGGLEMVRWWLYTWRSLGLDTAAQAMDLVLLTHPAAVAELPAECSLVEEGFRLNYSAAGRCLYKPYLGVAHRDKSYDPYMNSQECLFGPGSEFLGQYSHLLRADLDTFPGPRYRHCTLYTRHCTDCGGQAAGLLAPGRAGGPPLYDQPRPGLHQARAAGARLRRGPAAQRLVQPRLQLVRPRAPRAQSGAHHRGALQVRPRAHVRPGDGVQVGCAACQVQ